MNSDGYISLVEKFNVMEFTQAERRFPWNGILWQSEWDCVWTIRNVNYQELECVEYELSRIGIRRIQLI